MKPSQWLLIVAATLALALAGCAGGEDGAPGPAGPPGTSVFDSAAEACSFCHRDGTIADIDDGSLTAGTHSDAAFVLTERLHPTVDSVEVITGGTPAFSLQVVVSVVDESTPTPLAVTGLTGHDIRFTLAELTLTATAVAGATHDQYNWVPYFTNTSGQATYVYGDALGGSCTETPALSGTYTCDIGDGVSALWDASALQSSTNLNRIAVQLESDTLGESISNGAGNFTPSGGTMVVDTPYAPTEADTRQVVTLTQCKQCHDADGDGDALAMHGGARRDIEFCVTCHNPTSIDPDSGNTVDFKVMIHKIHMGKDLPSVDAGGTYQIIGFNNSVHDYSKGGFPQPVTNCEKCHTGGTESVNYYDVPSTAACGSCHDTTTFDNNPSTDIHGDPFTHASKTDADCAGCHSELASTVERVTYAHRTKQIKAAAAGYGYIIDSATYSAPNLTVTFHPVSDPGGTDTPLDLANDPIFTVSGSSLNVQVGWKAAGKADYTNAGVGADDPSVALRYNLVSGGTLAPTFTLPTGATATASVAATTPYTVTVTIPLPATGQAARTGIVFIDGHPAEEVIAGLGADRLPVKNEVSEFVITGSSAQKRRTVVSNDTSSCDTCHDGLSLHGGNRQGDIRVCTTCHNSAQTDIADRPGIGTDGKAEESVDFKRLIHRIHAGRAAESGGVLIGTNHLFAGEFPPGSRLNYCSTCHDQATPTYKPELPAGIEGTTIDSGVLADQTDDLNISPTTAVCSSCHDGGIATNHMQVMGGSFSALEEDILY